MGCKKITPAVYRQLHVPMSVCQYKQTEICAVGKTVPTRGDGACFFWAFLHWLQKMRGVEQGGHTWVQRFCVDVATACSDANCNQSNKDKWKKLCDRYKTWNENETIEQEFYVDTNMLECVVLMQGKEVANFTPKTLAVYEVARGQHKGSWWSVYTATPTPTPTTNFEVILLHDNPNAHPAEIFNTESCLTLALQSDHYEWVELFPEAIQKRLQGLQRENDAMKKHMLTTGHRGANIIAQLQSDTIPSAQATYRILCALLGASNNHKMVTQILNQHTAALVASGALSAVALVAWHRRKRMNTTLGPERWCNWWVGKGGVTAA